MASIASPCLMSPSEGYRRAQYQRPGVVIVMGPYAARERQVEPLSPQDLARLPGGAQC